MGRRKKGGALLRLVIDSAEVRVRKAYAPAARPMQDRRKKDPRRRPDHMADAAQ